jgi:subtilisin family serine protease
VTEQEIAGHGTHVASIAAGDGSASGGLYKGVAPEADLIVVKAGDNGFSTDNIIAAISYIRQKAVELNEPFVINMSLGNHDGAHDGTAAEEIAVDAELNNAVGRQIVIAAGNEGSDAIHTDGVLTQGGAKVFSFSIPAYTANTDVQDDYAYITMWYHNGDNLAVKVKSPNGFQLTSLSGQKNQSSTTDGFIEIDNAQSGVNPNNNSKNCTITIIDVDKTKIPMTGSWEVTVTGSTVTQGGAFDAWMGASTMDATVPSGATFTKLVGMPGTAESGITVGSYVTKWSWKAFDNNTYTYNGADRTGNFSTFSSMGPTRDGRLKPDISAPGQAIGAAYSTASSASNQVKLPGGKYLIEQGTSMASPHVAGLVALMLQAKPSLTAAQIRSVINATARKDAFTGAGASAQWGNGKADAAAAVQNVLSVERETGKLPIAFSLDQNYPNPFNPATQIRFSIPMRSAVTLTIYSLLGEKITTLVNDQLEPGNYSAAFNGNGVSSGVYFYTLTTSVSSITKKMVLLR